MSDVLNKINIIEGRPEGKPEPKKVGKVKGDKSENSFMVSGQKTTVKL